MNDKMRESAEQAYTMTAHDYCANPVGSRDWTLFWRGWQAATADQPTQGEAVAVVTDCVTQEVAPNVWEWRAGEFSTDRKLPIGTKLYTAPPAPAVPDGWKMVPVEATDDMEGAACRELRERGCPVKLSDIQVAWSVMLAAAPAPEVPRG